MCSSDLYAMTGWRCGWMVAPKPVVQAANALQSHSTSNVSSITQRAAVAALTGPQDCVEQMVAEFEKRRDFIVDGLNAIPGITCQKPLGAFYVFPNVKGLGMSSKELADKILAEAGVAVLSGTAFGEYGEGYLRLSYAHSIPNIQKALDRIGALAKTLA